MVKLNNAHGKFPQASLIEGNDENFYGTTNQGGKSDSGTVFKVTPAGVFTTLYNFTGESDGAEPVAALVLGRDGSFYGTTPQGGTGGSGTVFQVTPDGAFTTLYSFSKVGTDGTNSDGVTPTGLIQGSDGNFYGTTDEGGASGVGTVFKITYEGTLTTLVTFNNINGARPSGALVQGNDGAFYGTTGFEGASIASDPSGYGSGTVFRVMPDGLFTTLVNFQGDNGAFPAAGLMLSNDGDFYGTTDEGGASNNGTVFKMTPAGALTTLVNFDDTYDGASIAPLIQGSDGNFYGTTDEGGASGYGTVFKMTPGGLLTILINF